MTNESLWVAKSNTTNYDKISKDEVTDVCVVGGGIVGAVTSYLLLKNNVNVIVLEKDRVGMGVTANSTAKLTSQHGLIYNYLENEFGIEYAEKYLYSNENGIKLAEEIIKNENIECDFEKKDAYVFATNESEVKKIKSELETLKRIGFLAEFVEKVDIPAENVLGALKFDNQAQFNSREYTVNLFNRVSNMGGKIYENSMVEKIEFKDGKYIIYTDKYNVVAKSVVMATHYPIKNFPGMYFIKMYQDKSYAIAVEAENNIDGMYIQSSDPVISFRTAKYDGKDILVVAGSGHKTGKTDVDIEECYKNLENYIRKYYPNSKVLYRWSTEDCVTLDKIPYIGEFSTLLPNMYVATGFKKWGMSTSHVAARIISDMILGRENKYKDIYRATRVGPVRNIKEFGNILKESTYSLFINKVKKSNVSFDDINLGQGGIIDFKGQKIGIYKREDGKIFAVKPYCGHLGCLVSWNNLEKTWDCPCHGSRYDYMGNIITEPTVKGLDSINVEFE